MKMITLEIPLKSGDYSLPFIGGTVMDKKVVGGKLQIRMLVYAGNATQTCEFCVRAYKNGGDIKAGGFLGIYQTTSGELVVTGTCFA